MEKKHMHIFPNGFRLIYQKPTNPLKMTSIFCYCNVGSVLEKTGIKGVSHLVEHMVFKGTQKIPDSRDIFLSFDKIGAYFNAFTEKRLTCYTVKCADMYVDNCTAILADMLLHSTFPKDHFIKEQKVVLEENIRNENSMMNVLGKQIDAIVYANSSYAYPIDTLAYHKNEISYETTIEWYRFHYIPSNFVYSIVSNLSFETIKKMISKSMFAKAKSQITSTNKICLFQPPKEDKIQIISTIKPGASTNVIMIAFRTCSYRSDDCYIFKIVKHVLNGMSGRLFMALRDKNGLTYSPVCNTENVEHSGNIMVTAESSPDYTIIQHGVLPLLIHMFIHLKKNGITAQELLVAKGNIRGNYILKSELNDTIASYNGLRCLHPESTEVVSSYFDIYKKHIEPITLKEVNSKIREYFIPGNMVIGIIGDNPPTNTQIHKISKHFK